MDNAEIYKESIAKLLKETDDIVFQIRSLKHKNQELTAENDKDIAELFDKLLETEATMKKTLTESKEDAIKPKCGWAHFRKMNDKVIFTDATIIEIEIEYPDDKEKYIKISKSLKLNPIKKDLEDGLIKLNEMTIEKQLPKFEYKFTG